MYFSSSFYFFGVKTHVLNSLSNHVFVTNYLENRNLQIWTNLVESKIPSSEVCWLLFYRNQNATNQSLNVHIYKCEIKIKIPKLSSDVESWMGLHDARERERKKLGVKKLNRKQETECRILPRGGDWSFEEKTWRQNWR